MRGGASDAVPAEKPTVLALSAFYFPAQKAGGGPLILAGIVEGLGDEVRFRVMTRDRDIGEDAPYTGIEWGSWQPVGKAEVKYLAPRDFSLKALRRLVCRTEHDAMYFNSFFSPYFVVRLLLLRRLGLIPKKPVVLTPAGEFSPGALALKRSKKLAYIAVAKALGLYRDVLWHAASEHEERDIRRVFGPRVAVQVAPYLPAGHDTQEVPRRKKVPGRLRAVFLSRISPKKNLDGALRMLRGVEGDVSFSVYGPAEDEGYLAECRKIAGTLPKNVEVSFMGPVSHDEVAGVMAAHDLFLFPTHGESFGYVILESLLAGTPVLTSDQTPWRGLRKAGVGFDLPLDREEDFRRALLEFAKMDDEEHHRWSRRAWAYGVERARDESAVERNREMFRRALGKRPS
jgi:glycosyltransferase involved in cell wall biosynthesis